jgi:hypothetical protein
MTTTRFRKKKILLVGLSLILLYMLWLGYHLINFKTYTQPPDSARSHEVVGAYHIHTSFSDGKKSLESITKIAEKNSLDFIILADHGNPNYESILSQGWHGGILVLAGSELSVNRGHLVALGFEPSPRPFSHEAEEAAIEIQRSGGFSIIAHPYSKTRWTWGDYAGYSGIEIINADTMLKKNFLTMLPFLPSLAVRPELSLLKLLDSPEKNLKKWDELTQKHPVYGFYSTDAHVLYHPLFSFLRLHLGNVGPLPQDFTSAKHIVLEALRHGNFYNAVDAAAQASGFCYFSRKEQEDIPMGSTIPFEPRLTLHVELPPFIKCEAYLIHNGAAVLKSSEKNLVYKVTKPGTYRVEVYLTERTPLKESCPWIISNPIFIRESTS